MDTARIDLKPASTVRILSIGGDLRLTGADSARLEAQAGRHGSLRLTSKADGVELTCEGGCLVFLPASCRVEIGIISGDGRVTDLTGPLAIETVQGDLRLRRLGSVRLGQVRGDLTAQRIRGDFAAEAAGGDAQMEKMEGDLRLASVGGDLRVGGLEGSLQAHCGGDASLTFAPRHGSESIVEAAGDVRVRVPPGASLRAELRAAGDLRAESSGARVPGPGSLHLTLRDGAASLTASAGGDLLFQESAHADPSDLAGAITAQVEAALVAAESDLQGDLGEEGDLATTVSDEVRRALDRALRRDREQGTPQESPAGEREREMILKMLAEHRITSEQAEALFRALESDE
ncbi:MAG TPA: hypothetical protein VK449_10240 [Anaerolineales bacterium]|nr:hypothetical protein [Anaerolineales bacterium]